MSRLRILLLLAAAFTIAGLFGCSGNDDHAFTIVDADLDGIADDLDPNDDRDTIPDDGAGDGDTYTPCPSGTTLTCDDNCRQTFNPDQLDSDGDGFGDACDNCSALSNVHAAATDCNGDGDTLDRGEGPGGQCDHDDDGFGDPCDNCADIYNNGQGDVDGDGDGDACDDSDSDGVVDFLDNCRLILNPANAAATDCNADGDTADPGEGAGQQCDQDFDGYGDACDNCGTTPNGRGLGQDDQADSDNDLVGNACEVDDDDDTVLDDGDGDGIAGSKPCDTGSANAPCDDNCRTGANAGQLDTDDDGLGDACDNCSGAANVNTVATDCNADGDVADQGERIGEQCDQDGDRVGDLCDNCRAVANAPQVDQDADGLGDECDNCPGAANVNAVATDCDADGAVDVGERIGEQCDQDGDGCGDACDPAPTDPLTGC